MRADREAIDIHDSRSAMIWILSEDGIQFSPHFPKTVFVWVKMHRNGTIYCPYETRAEQTGHAPSHTHDWDLNRDSMHDEHTVRGEFAHDRCVSMAPPGKPRCSLRAGDWQPLRSCLQDVVHLPAYLARSIHAIIRDCTLCPAPIIFVVHVRGVWLDVRHHILRLKLTYTRLAG